MTEQWQRQNEQYLASAIAWVRQVLERQAGVVSEEDVPTLTAESLEVAADGEFVPALVLLSQRFDL